MTPVTTRPAIDLDALIGPEDDYQRRPRETRLTPEQLDILREIDETTPMTVDVITAALSGDPDRTVVGECLRDLCIDGLADVRDGAGGDEWTRTSEGTEAVTLHVSPHELQVG